MYIPKTEFEKIEKVAEKKLQEIEEEYHRKYSAIFYEAARLLSKEEVLLYGGLAIHELMPKNKKIYTDTTLPDIDVFAYEPKRIAKKLMKHFKEKQFDFVSISKGLHQGTYKLYVHGNHVVDLTQVSKDAFQRLSENSVRGKQYGIAIANPEFLRLSLHTMMSQSNDAHRWTKVFQRLVHFYQVFPPKKCPLSQDDDIVPIPSLSEESADRLYEDFKKHKFVFFGKQEMEAMLESTSPYVDALPPIMVLVDRAPSLVAKRAKKLISEKVTIADYPADDFAPHHVFLMLDDKPVVGIFATAACVTYFEMKQRRVASIHTMLRMVLAMYMTDCPILQKLRDPLHCVAALISILQRKLVNRTEKKYQQFLLSCYGTQPGLATMRRERLRREVKKSP